MGVTLAFDVYGTLIDTNGVVAKLKEIVGIRAEEISRTWREKQLEYSFRRALMQNYENFAVCTKQALDYTSSYFNIEISDKHKQYLIDSYRILPAFEDVEEALFRLKAEHFSLYAFSNGSADAVEKLLVTAGIMKYFMGIVSTEDLRSFKPNPGVYSYFLRKSGASGSNAWLISSNSFDVIGAISAGMKAAWVRRSQESVFDPWGINPTLTVKNLNDIIEQIKEY